MAKTPKILNMSAGVITQATTNNTDLYTVSTTLTRTVLTEIVCGNNSTGRKYISFFVQSTGGTNYSIGGQRKKLQGTDDIDGGGEWTWQGAIPLLPTQKIVSIQEYSSGIDAIIMGYEE